MWRLVELGWGKGCKEVGSVGGRGWVEGKASPLQTALNGRPGAVNVRRR